MASGPPGSISQPGTWRSTPGTDSGTTSPMASCPALPNDAARSGGPGSISTTRLPVRARCRAEQTPTSPLPTTATSPSPPSAMDTPSCVPPTTNRNTLFCSVIDGSMGECHGFRAAWHEKTHDGRHSMTFGTRWLALAALWLLAHISSAAAQEKSTWDSIKETGVVRMGCINAEPWGFKDPKDGSWHGIGPGFNKLIAEELKVNAECVETTWATAVAGLQASQFDLVAGFDATPQQDLAIDFPQGARIYYAVAILV